MITKQLKVKDGRTIADLCAEIQKLTKPMTVAELSNALNGFTEVKVVRGSKPHWMSQEDYEFETYQANSY